MIRRQRRNHLWAWIVIAALLPISVAVIFTLAASQVIERAPQRLEPPTVSKGGGG
jgi:hypothetical protein